MATPTIKNGEEQFFTTLYEGNGAGQRVGKFVPFTDNGTIANSVIFNDADNAYLSRTNDAGDRTRVTISFWVKRGHLSGNIHYIFTSYDGSSTNDGYIRFNTDNTIATRIGSGSSHLYVTNRTFEDTSKWYHIMLSVNTNDSTAADRVKLYVDGDRITSFSTQTNAGSADTTQFNYSSATFRLGSTTGGAYDFDGYLAEFNQVDGTALTPSTFGVTDTSTGRWIPKALTGITYGTNGFRLTFADSSALGDDTSGNTNDFSVTNLVAGDQTTDSPTQNFPTVNISGPYIGSQQASAEGNLKIVMTAGSGYPTVRVHKEIPQSGKWYWEVKAEQVGNIVGIQNACYGVLDLNLKDANQLTVGKPFSRQIGGMGLEMYSGAIFTGLLTSAGESATDFTIGSTAMGDDDYIVFAFDMDNGKAWWGWNDSSAGSSVVWFANDGGTDGNPSTGANPTVTFKPSNHRFVPAQSGFAPGSSDGAGGTYASNFIYNFGSKSFAFTAPTGFSGLSQNNFPATDKGVSGLTWTKNRDGTDWHYLVDSSRGNTKVLNSNDTAAEETHQDGVQKFLKGGISVEDRDNVNKSDNSFVNWTWVANSGTTSTNTDGNVTCNLQVNNTAKFSIQTWTNTGAGTKTIGHGLGVKPGLIIQKRTDTTSNWFTYHHSLTGNGSYLHLNTTDATQTGSDFANTEPTSSVFSSNASGSSSATFVSYCWAEVEGFSKFGKFVGNGNADGPFIYTGFKPAWIVFKANRATNWYQNDGARSPFNPVTIGIDLNSSAVEYDGGVYVGGGVDYLSNGFKIRQTTGLGYNYSGEEIYYMAWAKHPFVGDGTSPVTAR